MQTTIQKWGNSLAVRLPITYVKETGLKDGQPVNLTVEDGNIIISSIDKKYTLKMLINMISAENLHTEIQSGEPQGNEIW